MIAQNYIRFVTPFTPSDERKKSIDVMLNNLCFEMPVIEDNHLIGFVDLEECLFSEEDTIASLVEHGTASVQSTTHLFDVLHIFNESPREMLCVLNQDLAFEGVITKGDVIDALSKTLSVEQLGATLFLETASPNYSISELGRIVEGEGAQILGLWINNVDESGRIRISIKLNTTNAERIILSLQRFNYEVLAAFGDDDYKENVERRYQSLMKYLDF